MPNTNVAPLTPMTPDAAISAFTYLRAVQAGNVEGACNFADPEPRIPAQLVHVRRASRRPCHRAARPGRGRAV
ncbi:hypothetical protein Q3V23_00480 [Streptomyces sp. VNUA116]|uniref:hypothetical protein n=1 Tax=Streptomyces sp. VNUA116 TaxID=3062449 RepID=UPI0026765A07|nr:hypothetical protein [Streptomyces sp. VNUA116]WKU42671.1 hypothetical protein Q3V23_00480 [Streptomyces sp. VNUA116]